MLLVLWSGFCLLGREIGCLLGLLRFLFWRYSILIGWVLVNMFWRVWSLKCKFFFIDMWVLLFFDELVEEIDYVCLCFWILLGFCLFMFVLEVFDCLCFLKFFILFLVWVICCLSLLMDFLIWVMLFESLCLVLWLWNSLIL